MRLQRSLLTEPVLVATRGPGTGLSLLGRALGRPVRKCNWILDEAGRPLGYSAASGSGSDLGGRDQTRHARLLSRAAAGSKRVLGDHSFDLSDLADELILRVGMGMITLTVRDATGAEVGVVRPHSHPCREAERIRFVAPDPRAPIVSTNRTWDHREVGSVVQDLNLGWSGDQDVVDHGGKLMARIRPLPGCAVRLDKLGAIDEPLNSLLAAYLCALLQSRFVSSHLSD